MEVSLDLPLIYLLGIETAFTPCFFPIIPVFLTYISRSGREKAFLASVLFAAGITASFVLYGFAAAYSAGFIQMVLSLSLELITVELGLLFVGLGLALLTPFKEALAMLSVPTPRIRKITLANAFVLGFLFSIIAAPCAATYLFAIISTTLLKAMGDIGYAVAQLAVYGAGISTPFLAIGLLTQKLGTRMLRSVSKSFLVRHNEEIAGVITVLLGIVTMASIEDFTLYLGQASEALRPLIALLFAATGVYYAVVAARSYRYVEDMGVLLVSAGFLAVAGGLVAEQVLAALGAVQPWILRLATRGLLLLGVASMGLRGLAAVGVLGDLSRAAAVIDGAAAALWGITYGRLGDRRHLWATLYLLGLAAYDAGWSGLPGWTQACLAVFTVVAALNLYPAASGNRGALSGLRLLVEEESL